MEWNAQDIKKLTKLLDNHTIIVFKDQNNSLINFNELSKITSIATRYFPRGILVLLVSYGHLDIGYYGSFNLKENYPELYKTFKSSKPGTILHPWKDTKWIVTDYNHFFSKSIIKDDEELE